MQATSKETRWLALLILFGLMLFWLTSCGGTTLTLGQPGQPTLVFIYTDG